MRLRLSIVGVLFVLALAAVAAVAAPQAQAANPNANAVTVPVTGPVANGGTFTGLYTLNRFSVVNGALTAVGTVSGTITDALGNTVGTVTNVPVSLPVAPTGSCQILHLTLGPLDLNLLGLQVHLNQVVLDITAQPGPGNLLGNLLCAVAGLLDNNGLGSLNGVANLLNQILGRL